jgi:hypothetical protein
VIRWGLRNLTLIRGGVSAITFGHVVLGADAQSVERIRTHERVHVCQYQRWGLFFMPAYVLASLWVGSRGGDAYMDNPFEPAARRLDLGASARPVVR